MRELFVFSQLRIFGMRCRYCGIFTLSVLFFDHGLFIWFNNFQLKHTVGTWKHKQNPPTWPNAFPKYQTSVYIARYCNNFLVSPSQLCTLSSLIWYGAWFLPTHWPYVSIAIRSVSLPGENRKLTLKSSRFAPKTWEDVLEMNCQKVQIFGRAQNMCSESCWVHVSLDLRKSNFRSVQAVFNFKLSDGTSKTNGGGGDPLCRFVPSVVWLVHWSLCPIYFRVGSMASSYESTVFYILYFRLNTFKFREDKMKKVSIQMGNEVVLILVCN